MKDLIIVWSECYPLQHPKMSIHPAHAARNGNDLPGLVVIAGVESEMCAICVVSVG